MATFLDSTALLFVLLNPFLLSLYLAPLLRELDPPTFRRVVTRAALIATGTFIAVGLIGDAVFTDVLQVRYAAFQVFGGLIFLVVGFRFVMDGADSLRMLRGGSAHLSGSVAMPFLIGPATISASILAGSRLSPGLAVLAILSAMTLSTAALILIKVLHDRLQAEHTALIDRYWEVTGRVMALVIGTLAVEMIFQGVEGWLAGPLT